MRQAFDLAGLPTPDYAIFSSDDLIEKTTKLLEWNIFPCVLKPVDNMGARGVSIARNSSELICSLESALRDSHSGIAIAERFINGPEYSIDAVWIKNRLVFAGIAERHIYFDPYRIELGHSFPASIDTKRQEALRKAMQDAGAAMGIHRGALKGDVFWENETAVIGEVAARISGGFMSGWTFPLHSGTSSIAAVLCDAVDIPVPDILLEQLITHPESNPVHERAIISFPGTVASFEGANSTCAEPELAAIWQAADTGSHIGILKNNVGKCGNIILKGNENSSFDSLNLTAQSILNRIKIRMEDNNQDSIDFLLSPEPLGPLLYSVHQWGDMYRQNGSQLIKLADSLPHIHKKATWWQCIERDWVGRSIQDHLQLALSQGLVTFDSAFDESDSQKNSPEISEIVVLRAVSRAGLPGLEYIIRQIRLMGRMNV